MLAICIYIYIYFVLCIHSLGATRFWKGVMQGSWSLETTVLKPLLLGYTLQLLTRYNGDRFSNGCGQVFLSVKGSTHIEVTGPISLPTKQALHGAKGGSVVSTACDPDPSEFSAVGIQTERVGLARSREKGCPDHPHPPDREQLGAAIADIQKVCYEWCVYGYCCGR